MCPKHGSQINCHSYVRNLFTITAYTLFILGLNYILALKLLEICVILDYFKINIITVPLLTIIR
jgi:hypothetical protein